MALTQPGRGSISGTVPTQFGRGSGAAMRSSGLVGIPQTPGGALGSSSLPGVRMVFHSALLVFGSTAVFAPGFMRIRVFGDVNVGLCFGVLEFASTFAIAVGYHRWADADSTRCPAGCGSGWKRDRSIDQPCCGYPRGHRRHARGQLRHLRGLHRGDPGHRGQRSRAEPSTTDYYAGGRAFTGWQNGIATGGDYLSAASFLGIAGIIALAGYDGFLYSVGFLVGWLLVLLLVAGCCGTPAGTRWPMSSTSG